MRDKLERLTTSLKWNARADSIIINNETEHKEAKDKSLVMICGAVSYVLNAEMAMDMLGKEFSERDLKLVREASEEITNSLSNITKLARELL